MIVGQRIPFRETLLVALAAGLDTVLTPTRSTSSESWVRSWRRTWISRSRPSVASALIIVPHYGWQWTFIFAIVPALLVFGLRWIIHKSVRFQQAIAEIEQRLQELGVAAWP